MSKEIGSGGWPPPPSALDIDLAVDLRCIENASRPLYEKSWLPCVGTSTFSSEAYEGSGCCATNHTSVYKSGWMPGTCEFDCEAREHIFSCKGEYKFGLGWGLVLSLFADCVISVGLALQKVAHNRLATAARITASQKGAEPEEVRGNAYLKMRVWWAGMLLTISGEVCNFASYGDRDTPASVVASVGCVGVICNWFIATFFLHEEFRKRDVIGVASIITGVILIIVFVPKDPTGGTSNLLPCPIVYSGNFTSVDIPCGAIPAVLRDTPQPAPSTGGSAVWFVSAGADVCAKFGSFAPFSDYWYLVQPVWLVYFFFNLALFVGCYVALRRWGHKHALSFLSLADIAGGATVCSAVTVSTFLFEYIIGSGFEKIYVAAEPVFWLMLVVLVTTAVFQVAYLNKAMQFYAISVVVPMHIVLFTLASIVGPSILYQELTLDENKLPYTPAVHASCFVLGIFLTFSGIGVLSTGPRRPVGLDESNLEMMAKVKANGEGIVAVSDQGETQLEFPPATPGAGSGTERGNNGSGSRGISFLSGSGLPLILSPLGTFSMSPAAELMPASIPIRADVRRASLPASFGGSPGVLLAAGGQSLPPLGPPSSQPGASAGAPTTGILARMRSKSVNDGGDRAQHRLKLTVSGEI